MSENNSLGEKAEKLAIIYLKQKGHRIRHTNWRYKHKELDIISEDRNELVFSEVKCRTGDMTEPFDAVTKTKQRFIIDAANAYIEKYDIDKEVRFDIISIVAKGKTYKIEHIDDAFYPEVNR